MHILPLRKIARPKNLLNLIHRLQKQITASICSYLNIFLTIVALRTKPKHLLLYHFQGLEVDCLSTWQQGASPDLKPTVEAQNQTEYW